MKNWHVQQVCKRITACALCDNTHDMGILNEFVQNPEMRQVKESDLFSAEVTYSPART